MSSWKDAGKRDALAVLGMVKKSFEGSDELAGGAADHMDPEDFDRRALAAGTEHETEHVKDRRVAAEIASDHLAEDPAYYRKLRKIEK